MSLVTFLRDSVPSFTTLLRRSTHKIFIEEWPSRLHFRTTSIMLTVFGVLLSGTEYWGQNIRCLPVRKDGEDVLDAKFIETFCFIQTTFTVPYDREGRFHESKNSNVATGELPGGWPLVEEGKEATPKVYHAYYQWVPFYLFFLALFFRVSHVLWRGIENNAIKSLIQQLNAKDLKIISEKQAKQVKLLVSYIWRSRGTHFWFSSVYVFCELLNLAVVCSSMYLTDVFLNGQFAQYGLKALKFLDEDPETRVDPMSFVFPHLTKCQFRRFGPSGSIESFDTICFLSSNVLNEKIFVFIWMWFVLLTTITILVVLYRCGTIFCDRVRMRGLNLSPELIRNSQLISIVNRFGFCDWMLLRLIRINLDELTFMKLMSGLFDELTKSNIAKRCN